MKKVILLTGVMIMMYAASAFATTATTAVTGLGVSGFALSKNVVAVYGSAIAAVSGTGFQYYGIATQHASGSKMFGAISTNSGIGSKDASSTFGTGNCPTIPTAATETTLTGWSSM